MFSKIESWLYDNLWIVVLIVMLTLLVFVYWYGDTRNKEVYGVWVKCNPTYNRLTFEEWNKLRKYDLLPNTYANKTNDF
jgi:hypothetical protein